MFWFFRYTFSVDNENDMSVLGSRCMPFRAAPLLACHFLHGDNFWLRHSAAPLQKRAIAKSDWHLESIYYYKHVSSPSALVYWCVQVLFHLFSVQRHALSSIAEHFRWLPPSLLDLYRRRVGCSTTMMSCLKWISVPSHSSRIDRSNVISH